MRNEHDKEGDVNVESSDVFAKSSHDPSGRVLVEELDARSDHLDDHLVQHPRRADLGHDYDENGPQNRQQDVGEDSDDEVSGVLGILLRFQLQARPPRNIVRDAQLSE